MGGDRKYIRIHLLCAEELLRKLVRELDQDIVRSAVGVPEEGHDDVAVTEAQDGLWPVPRESGQLEKEGELDALSAVCVLLLRRGQVGLHDHRKVLDVYDPLLALLSGEAALFRQLP